MKIFDAKIFGKNHLAFRKIICKIHFSLGFADLVSTITQANAI